MVKKIFLGAPGAGKGTYASRIAPILKIPHISTGDLFRENLKNETDVGLQAKEYMDQGLLVPDEVVIEMLKNRVQEEDCKDGFILDGFPRTVAQAEALKELADIDVVVNLDVPEEVILERLAGRMSCKNCGKIYHKKNIIPKKEGVCDDCKGELYERDDDKEETVKKRLKTYEESTKPLIDFYQNLGILKNIKVVGAPEKAIADIFKSLIKG